MIDRPRAMLRGALAGVGYGASAFWILVAVGSFGVFGVGAWLIRRNLMDAVRGTPAAMRAEQRALEPQS